jgi:predicted nucleotidyltransferase component of viral defense system
MIPAMNIVAWGRVVPWTESRQVEQDLIISRALVELFRDPFLAGQLRFRGGTALNKLHFPAPLRYSEDIDLVRTSSGPIGPVLDAARRVLEPWMGRAQFEQSPVAPKLRFRIPAEDSSSPAPIRIKVEINTREITAYDPPQTIPFAVSNPWFAGEAAIPTFSNEEMLATKLRALLQRDKGRDLIDLAHAREVFSDLDIDRVVASFARYLEPSGQAISRAQAEERMFAKLQNRAFLADVRPLLAADAAARFGAEAGNEAFQSVFTGFVTRLPGAPWARTREMSERLGMPELATSGDIG